MTAPPRRSLSNAEAAACPVAAQPALLRYLAGEASPEIALMHLLLATGAMPALDKAVEALAAASGGPEFARLARLAGAHRDTLARAARVVEVGLTAAEGEDPIASIRARFDRAVTAAPEASVALYSLGDPAILDRATAELVGLLGQWGLLGRDRDALDIGCGIGRLERALAPRLGHILGIDLSSAMIAEAERRCAGIANLTFAVCDGRGLSQFAADSFDLILAVDSFPYVVAASCDASHIEGAARMLRPGGAFAIFNYSYRGDLAADRADIAAHAATAGLTAERNGSSDLELWDGISFLLRKPPLPPRRG